MGQAQTRPKFRNRIKNSGPSKSLPPAAIQLRMEGWLEDDLADDLQSVSFSSATTTTTAYGGAAVNRSNSSSSDNLHHAAASASGHGSSPISAADLRLIRRLGAGDIGAVYLAELKSSKGVFFAVKLMDRKELAGRRKENRARTERELLKLLDHPFLPTLYASFDSANFSGLLTEFCPGGDLHVLRQKQPAKRFDEAAVRFYVAEVVAALEYIHMKGIIYRDLKPENVLVRADGHIMLTDFDLSLRCDDSLAQVLSQQRLAAAAGPVCRPSYPATSSILPACIVPGVSCLRPRWRRKKKPPRHPRTQFVAEPTDVRSMSFVGTHEYLAPEIVSGEGHGSAVDWWTLGVFMFELLYGVTPFKGSDNDLTLANIVARALEFPKDPPVSSSSKDLLTHLLVKDPSKRLGAAMGSVSVKRHPFFLGTNWALLRCAAPPYIPPPFNRDSVSDRSGSDTTVEYY